MNEKKNGNKTNNKTPINQINSHLTQETRSTKTNKFSICLKFKLNRYPGGLFHVNGSTKLILHNNIEELFKSEEKMPLNCQRLPHSLYCLIVQPLFENHTIKKKRESQNM